MREPLMRMQQAVVAQMQRAQGRVRPELVVGPGRLYEVPRMLRDQGVRCVMVVTSAGFVRRGVVASFTNDLMTHGIAAAVFSEVTHDPDSDCVERAAAFYRSRGCEAVVALGGGSVIDCAKVAAALAVRPGKRVSDLVGVMKVRKALPYFIAVPTTAGTGSEITLAAVITDAATHRKYAVSDIALIPDAAVLDANLLLGLPADMTAGTGMDALTHAVEAYTNRFASRIARENAEQAVSLVFEHLKASYDDGKNVHHRENMLIASYCAGVAFSNATVGYVHALAHAVGAKYGIAHGWACGVLLPVVLEEYGQAAEGRLARLARAVGMRGANDHELTTLFIARIRELSASIGVPGSFPELREQDIPELAAQAQAEGNPAYPVPEIWDTPRFEKVLHRVCGEGQPQAPEVREELPVVDRSRAAEQAAPSPRRRKGVRIAAAGAGVGVVAGVIAAVGLHLRNK